MHETTNGPFVPNETEFAPWCPDGSDPAELLAYLDRLRSSPCKEMPLIDESPLPVATAVSAPFEAAPLEKPRSGPTLTAVICNYNHGHYISRAIEAMLAQTRPADEFMIVDDGSTDESVSIIQSWVTRYPQIRFLRNEKNLGFHASFERALAAATGDFVYSGAADDRVLPGFFAGAMQLAAAHPETGVISGQFISVDPSGRALSTDGLTNIHQAVFLDPASYLREVLMKEPATLSLSAATILRRQPLMDVGGYRVELGSWGDTFAIQALGLQHGFCYWPHPAMEWTIVPGSLSETTRSDPLKALRIVDRAAELMRSEPFRKLFPPDYVQHWVRGFQQSIAHQQLHRAIEGNQALQDCRRSVAKSANLPTRWLLEILGGGMRVMYFITFRVLRFVVAGQLAEAAAAEKSTQPQAATR